ncbi:hypothetical protein BJX61DRAFT_451732 [Aspergillus egyptiacus]|nr:hypothetical protein BJX61DRAFT_451732 [Aspergillus egyptiacus]
MAETLDLLGVIGTWVAVFLAIIALAGIIPAYILYRESQTDQYEAISQIDDRTHEYISEGYTLLPGKRFLWSIKVPNLTEPPVLAPEAADGSELRVKRDCDLLDRDGSPSLTSWVNFANLLRAYSISPARDGKLRFSGTEALLPVHRSWILLLGLVDRYAHREDSGLFVDEPADPDWGAFDSEALYGLSGILQRMRPGREWICFRMHSVAHMRSMPFYIPAEDTSLRNLLFLFLGYLPAADGSLYCSAVESNASGSGLFVPRSTKTRTLDVFYKMKELGPNEVPVRDRRLAEEMGIQLPKIYRLGLHEARFDRDWSVKNANKNTGMLDDVQYIGLEDDGEARIWLHPSATHSMILALLRLDLNAQSFLCGDDLKQFFERLLPDREKVSLFLEPGAIDMLQIQQGEKEQVKMGIEELRSHGRQPSNTHSRHWASALAKLDQTLRSLREKYDTPDWAMHTIAILYMTEPTFRTAMGEVSCGIDPPPTASVCFKIDVAQNKVHVPTLAVFPRVQYGFDFAAVFGAPRSEKGPDVKSLNLPLWQAMLAALHASVKWHLWSTALSARDLSVLHTQLNRIVYISTQDLPDQQEDKSEPLLDVASACRELTTLLRKSQKNQDDGGEDDGIQDDDEDEVEEEEDDDDDDESDDGYDEFERMNILGIY